MESYSNFDVDRIIGDLLYASANRFGGVVLLNISESPELIAALKKNHLSGDLREPFPSLR